jgi:hypothetical protein
VDGAKLGGFERGANRGDAGVGKARQAYCAEIDPRENEAVKVVDDETRVWLAKINFVFCHFDRFRVTARSSLDARLHPAIGNSG